MWESIISKLTATDHLHRHLWITTSLYVLKISWPLFIKLLRYTLKKRVLLGVTLAARLILFKKSQSNLHLVLFFQLFVCKHFYSRSPFLFWSLKDAVIWVGSWPYFPALIHDFLRTYKMILQEKILGRQEEKLFKEFKTLLLQFKTHLSSFQIKDLSVQG